MKVLYFVFSLALFSCSQADDCNCRFKTDIRIINGQIAAEHSIPWIVSIAEKDTHICGGSIMNEKFILTAAHCTDNKDVKKLFVRVGIHNIKDQIPKDQIYSVKKVHVKEYKGVTVEGDIAIIELNKNIKFNDGVIEKGCFNLDEKTYSDNLLVAGWGMTERTYIGPQTKKLVFNGEATNLKQAFFSQILNCEDYLICIKPINEEDSTCHGDSGGPIHYTENGITKVEGVSSRSDGKYINDIGYYCVGTGGYSRLSHYADWISKTAQYNFCGTHEKKEEKKFFGLF